MNPKQAPLFQNPYQDATIEDIRNIPLFKNCTDEQAQVILEVIREFTEIIIECFQKHCFHQSNDQKAKVVNFKPDNHSKAA
jgi:hypothetical protein